MVSRHQTADHVRRAYRRQAPRYDRAIRITSRFFDIDGGRRRACGAARGQTLEIGLGTGLNLPLYGPTVDLTAIDLTPEMLERARARPQTSVAACVCTRGTPAACPFPTRPSTPSSRR
jgi:SAM-dependent methyltransferase